MVAAAGVFTLGFTVCAIIALFRHESSFSYSPLYNEGSGAFAQIVRIAAISPWAFIGFENVSHFSEEYDFPVKRVRRILIWSVLITTLLYLFVSLLSISAYPPEYESWLAYIRDMGNLVGIKAVPAFYAAEHYWGQAGVTMKVSHMEDDQRFIVVGVSDVDEQVKQQREAERMEEERIAYSRMNALTGDMMCAFIVVPETGRYRQYSAASFYSGFGLPLEGEDFFTVMRDLSGQFVCPEDVGRFCSLFTREGVLSAIERSGIFSLSYRLKLGDKLNYVQIKAAMVEEKEGARLIVGINDVDSSVRQEEEYARRLAHARNMASIDALTGIKNKHAFLEAEEKINRHIAEKTQPEFAVIVLDVNDLKKINDTEGHQAGDQYLRDACKFICNVFKHSPVFRVGGDEFAVISQGSDYACIEQLVRKVNDHNSEAARSGGIVIACGMAKYRNDDCVAAVYERADQNMYENKSVLKAGKK